MKRRCICGTQLEEEQKLCQWCGRKGQFQNNEPEAAPALPIPMAMEVSESPPTPPIPSPDGTVSTIAHTLQSLGASAFWLSIIGVALWFLLVLPYGSAARRDAVMHPDSPVWPTVASLPLESIHGFVMVVFPILLLLGIMMWIAAKSMTERS